MLFSIQTINQLGEAYRAGKNGEVEKGQAILTGCLPAIELESRAMHPDEQMMMYATAGNARMACKMWEQAASLFEQVCSLAEQMDPMTLETAGDYRCLGQCYAAFGKWESALTVYQKAREILLEIQVEDRYIVDINKLIQDVEQNIQSSSKQETKTTPLLLRILDRRRKPK